MTSQHSGSKKTQNPCMAKDPEAMEISSLMTLKMARPVFTRIETKPAE